MHKNDNSKIYAPNYTQIPNVVIDYWLPRLSPTEFSVLIFFCRQTFGWHRSKVQISLKQLVEALQLKKDTIIKAIDSLSEKELIIIHKNKIDNVSQVNTYEINVIEVPENSDDSPKNGLPPVQKIDHPVPPTSVSKNEKVGSPKNGQLRIKKDTYKKKKILSRTEDSVAVCDALISSIRKNNEHFKQPSKEKWESEIDLMLRVDKRDVEVTKKIIEFCANDNFWKTRILSPHALRKHWDALFVQMKNPYRGNKIDRTLRNPDGTPMNPSYNNLF